MLLYYLFGNMRKLVLFILLCTVVLIPMVANQVIDRWWEYACVVLWSYSVIVVVRIGERLYPIDGGAMSIMNRRAAGMVYIGISGMLYVVIAHFSAAH